LGWYGPVIRIRTKKPGEGGKTAEKPPDREKGKKKTDTGKDWCNRQQTGHNRGGLSPREPGGGREKECQVRVTYAGGESRETPMGKEELRKGHHHTDPPNHKTTLKPGRRGRTAWTLVGGTRHGVGKLDGNDRKR